MSKKQKKDEWSPDWAKAKTACRLNAEDVRKAKRLGMKPRSLLKNIPNKQQRWKKPVRDWIRDLYTKRFPNESPPRPAGPARFDRARANRHEAGFAEYFGEQVEFPSACYFCPAADAFDNLEPEPSAWSYVWSLEELARSMRSERSAAAELDQAVAMYSIHGAFNE